MVDCTVYEVFAAPASTIPKMPNTRTALAKNDGVEVYNLSMSTEAITRVTFEESPWALKSFPS